MDAKTILFMGRPGCGKGTQAAKLAEKTGFSIFSTGERFRELRAKRDHLGKRIKEEYDQGLLMPSWFATFLFQEFLLSCAPDDGVIFEGVGRKVFEAEVFNETAEWLRRPYVVFVLEVGEQEAARRQIERSRAGAGRTESDSEEKIRLRFEEFNKNTAPSILFFEKLGRVIALDGERSPEAIHKEVVGRLS